MTPPPPCERKHNVTPMVFSATPSSCWQVMAGLRVWLKLKNPPSIVINSIKQVLIVTTSIQTYPNVFKG